MTPRPTARPTWQASDSVRLTHELRVCMRAYAWACAHAYARHTCASMCACMGRGRWHIHLSHGVLCLTVLGRRTLLGRWRNYVTLFAAVYALRDGGIRDARGPNQRTLADAVAPSTRQGGEATQNELGRALIEKYDNRLGLLRYSGGVSTSNFGRSWGLPSNTPPSKSG